MTEKAEGLSEAEAVRLEQLVAAHIEDMRERVVPQIVENIRQDAAAAQKPPTPTKGLYVGAPACFALELECQHINRAFGGFGCYLVGSALDRPDWRDIDVRLIMADEEFAALFPDAGPVEHHRWEFDARWLLLTTAISDRLSKATGLPVDFQFQPQSHANTRHKKRRSALGLIFGRGDPDGDGGCADLAPSPPPPNEGEALRARLKAAEEIIRNVIQLEDHFGGMDARLFGPLSTLARAYFRDHPR